MKLQTKKFYLSRHLFLAVIHLLVMQNAGAQAGALCRKAETIILGMKKETIDSMMVFKIEKMYKSNSSGRDLLSGLQQSMYEYHDKDWNQYTFRFVFKQDTLLYFDLHHFLSNNILYKKINEVKLNGALHNFNTVYHAKDSLASILISFYTTVFNLGEVDNFLNTATINDKEILLGYAKSVCPEYSAAAIIRINSLEKEKQFLTKAEKEEIVPFINTTVRARFIVGCMWSEERVMDFINKMYN